MGIHTEYSVSSSSGIETEGLLELVVSVAEFDGVSVTSGAGTASVTDGEGGFSEIVGLLVFTVVFVVVLSVLTEVESEVLSRSGTPEERPVLVVLLVLSVQPVTQNREKSKSVARAIERIFRKINFEFFIKNLL